MGISRGRYQFLLLDEKIGDSKYEVLIFLFFCFF